MVKGERRALERGGQTMKKEGRLWERNRVLDREIVGLLLKISDTAERTAKTILKLQKKNERSQLV
jgi:hypothetical protein